MPFKPQTKRFALVPVEPGAEKITDIEVTLYKSHGHPALKADWNGSGNEEMLMDEEGDLELIAALGFPTEGEKSVSELSAIPKELK